jgi:hypothetical protein
MNGISTAFAQSCQISLVTDPPFYLTTVTENKVDKFALPKKASLESRDPAAENEISSELFYRQPKAFKENASVLGRGSVVTLTSPQDQSMLSDQTSNSLVAVKVISAEDRYSRFQPGVRAKAGQRGFISKNSLDPQINGKTFVLKQSAFLFKMDGVTKVQIDSGVYLRPEVQNGKYKVRKCPDGVSYVFKAITPFAPKQPYSETEVLLPPGNACLDLHAYTMPEFQELRKVQAFTNDLYKKSIGANEFEINDWGMVKVPFEDPPAEMHAANPDITGISPDGSFMHYQGSDPKDSDIWGQPKTVCALMKVMQDWSKKCDGQSDSRCTPETGDISFITPAKVIPNGRIKDGVDPLGHRSHFSGYCVDVRPFKKTEDTHGTTYLRSNYDKQRTRDFIDFLEHEGASPIYFNDPSLYKDKNIGGGSAACVDTNLETETGIKVRPCAGHNDHIHFCLLPANFQKLGC